MTSQPLEAVLLVVGAADQVFELGRVQPTVVLTQHAKADPTEPLGRDRGGQSLKLNDVAERGTSY